MSFANQNPYEATFPGFQVAAQAAESDRVAFIRRTYLHLAGAVGAFIALQTLVFALVSDAAKMRLLASLAANPMMWLVVLGVFMATNWVADSWARSQVSSQRQYLGLSISVVGWTAMFTPLLFLAHIYAESNPGVANPIPAAGIVTLMIFGGLTAIVFLTGSDFSSLGKYLWWGGLLAMGTIVCGIVFGFSLGFWFFVAMIGLASGYILYDTSNVLHRYRTDQHVAASVALFSSVALLFWYVLQLFMALSRD